MSTVYFELIRREPYIVSYWRLNDPVGSSQAIDYSSHNSLIGAYDGTPTLGPTLIQGDSSSGSRLFTSAKDMQVEDIAQLRLTSTFSLEAWVVPAVASQSANLISKLNAVGSVPGPYSLSLASGYPRISVGNGVTSVGVSAPSALPVGIPSHIVGTLFRGTLSLYVNGVRVATAPITPQVVADSGQPLFIAGNDVVNGVLDPSFAHDTIGGTPGHGWATYGTNSLGIISAAGPFAGLTQVAQAGYGNDLRLASASTATAYVPGETRVISAYVSIPSAWNGGQITLGNDFGGSRGDFTIGGVGSGPIDANMTLRNQWQRLATAITAGGSGFSGGVFIRAASAPTPGSAINISAVMEDEGPILQTYADGDTPGFAWSGTPGNSTSTYGFSGLIGEAAAYNGALSALRVARHFALGQQIITDPAHFITVDPPVYA